MFCETCTALIRQVEELVGPADNPRPSNGPVKHLNHHSTIDALLGAIATGCFICQVVAQQSPRILDPAACPKDYPPRGLRYDCIFDRESRKGGSSDIRLIFMTMWYGNSTTEFILRQIDGEILDRDQDTVPSSTGDDLVMSQARAWLKTCRDDHELCRKILIPKTIWSSRVLDLQPTGLPQHHVRLVERSSLPGNEAVYVTLSHRWGIGAEEPFKLTQLTEGHLRRGISTGSLSGLFRDAIKVCLNLGQRYLWIDSMCIFQDDSSSIVAEALAMGEVYGNAVCNIAALTAKQTSMFAERDPNMVAPSATILRASKFGTMNSYAIANSQLWSVSVFSAPLSQRGWVLQEQILAQRTIYFGQKQMLWTCPSGAFCETYPMNDPVWSTDMFRVYQRDFDGMRMTALQAVLQERGGSLAHIPEIKGTKLTHEDNWRHIVSDYVVRHLTNANDKLLAISGVATPFSYVTGDVLLAGLWRKGMPQNLLWQVGTSEDFTYSRSKIDSWKRNLGKGIPSWSWASTNNPVSFHPDIGRRKKVLARVESVETTQEVHGDTKRIVAGSLHLKAAGLKIYQCDAARKVYGLLQQGGGKEPKIACYVNTWFDMVDEDVTGTTYLAVFVTCSVYPDRKTKQIQRVTYEGLILQQNTAEAKDIFTRVGTFQANDILDEPGKVSFMPTYSTLAACIVSENGSLEFPPLDFDTVPWMHVFKIV